MSPDPTPPAGPIPDIGLLTREYAAIRELGRGGMGTVILARHRLASHEVAIKLSDAGAIANAEALGRLTREGKLLSTLRHPNIVRLYDVADMGRGRFGIVMEYVRGVSLAQILAAGGPLPLDRCHSILGDLASALEHAHERGVVHRDVKPPNVLVHTDSWAAKLCDFGIARAGSDDASVTGTGIVAGTPAYMAPEHIDGRPLDRRSDLYSLAVLGWEMITGQQPWRGLPLFDVLYHQKYVDLPSAADVRPDCFPSLLLALEGALAKAPQLRWAAAREMLDQLESDEPTERLLTLRADRRAQAEGNLDVERDFSDEFAVGPELGEDRRWKPAPVVVLPTAGEPGRNDRGEAAPTIPFERVASDTPVTPVSASLTVPVVPRIPAGVDAASAPAENAPRKHNTRRVLVWRALRKRRLRRVAALVALGFLGGWGATNALSRRVRAASPDGAAAAASSGGRPPASPSIDTLVSTPADGKAEPRAAVAQALPSPAAGFPAVPPPRSLPIDPRTVTHESTSLLPSRSAPPAKDASPVLTPSERVVLRAQGLMQARRFGEAERVIDSALASMPRREGGALYALRARMRAVRGDIREAWTDIEMAARTGARWEVLPLETTLRAQRDGRGAARAFLTDDVKAALTPRRMLEPDRAFGLARALVVAGDERTALAVLQQTRAPDPAAAPLFDDPAFAPLARDPRFAELRRRVHGGR